MLAFTSLPSSAPPPAPRAEASTAVAASTPGVWVGSSHPSSVPAAVAAACCLAAVKRGKQGRGRKGASKPKKRAPAPSGVAISSGGAAVLERPQAAVVPPVLELPAGSTWSIGENGEKSLFAGGLIGGQSIFASYDYNFDPLGISERLPFAVPFLRESELKHGRIAMLAFLGLLAVDVTRLPFLDVIAPTCFKSGAGGEMVALEAHDACIADQGTALPVSPLWIIFGGAALIEASTNVMKLVKWGGLTVENAGDFLMREELGAKLGLLPEGKEDMAIMKLQELKHCRLAMIAFSGAWAQGVLTAHEFPWVW